MYKQKINQNQSHFRFWLKFRLYFSHFLVKSKSGQILILMHFSLCFSLRKFGKNFKRFAILRIWQCLLFHFSRRRKISRVRKMHQNSQVRILLDKKIQTSTNFLTFSLEKKVVNIWLFLRKISIANVFRFLAAKLQ